MIKLVGIISSPRYEGNSATLLREVFAGAASDNVQTEEIYLPEHNLEYCRGCFTCLAEGKCVIPDDLELLRNKLIGADGIVLSSPTHGLEPSAIMKNFLDRIGLFSAYTSLLADKYVVSIATTGAVGARKVAKKMTSINGGFMKTGYVSGIMGVALDWDHVKEYPEYLAKANELGKTLVDDIQNENKYRLQKLGSRIINTLFLKRTMKRNILKHKDKRMKAVFEHLLDKGYMNRPTGSEVN